MNVVKSTSEINALGENFVVIIGNFDGVHIGHQHMIEQIKQNKKLEEKVIVLTFEPHPDIIISDRKNFLIDSKDQKYRKLAKSGVDYVYEVDFTTELRNMAPGDFIYKNIVEIANLKTFFMGPDFSLGKDRCYTISDAEKNLANHGIKTEVLEKLEIEKQVISSSLIREMIGKAKFAEVRKYLGADYNIRSSIEGGNKIGRKINFRTANLILDERRVYPETGVYCVKVYLNNEEHIGAMNIGKNPTISDKGVVKIEVHILDFSNEVYGCELKVVPEKKIRDEIKFSNLDSLRTQISKDIDYVKKYFND